MPIRIKRILAALVAVSVAVLIGAQAPAAHAATTPPPSAWYTLAHAAGYTDQQIATWASTDAWRTVPVQQSYSQGRDAVQVAVPAWFFKYYHATDRCWQLWDMGKAGDFFGDIAFYIKTTFVYCDNSVHVITYYDDNPQTVEKVYSWAAGAGWHFSRWSNDPEDYIAHGFYAYFSGYPYSGLQVWRTGVFANVYSGKIVEKRNWTHQYAHSNDSWHQSGGSNY